MKTINMVNKTMDSWIFEYEDRYLPYGEKSKSFVREEIDWSSLRAIGEEYKNEIDNEGRRKWALSLLSNRLGCLDFLNGRKGIVSSALDSHLAEEISKIFCEQGFKNPDFQSGLVEDQHGRKQKIGKVLGKLGQKHYLSMWEKRTNLTYEWRITTDVEEILSMSFNRSWTSCMRPGGAYHFGPLNEVYVGSAVMYFYRPGAQQPCGRELLRPMLLNGDRPAVLRANTIYGNGISVPADDFCCEIPVYSYPEEGAIVSLQEAYLDNGGEKILRKSYVAPRSATAKRMTKAFGSEISAVKSVKRETIVYKDLYPNNRNCGVAHGCPVLNKMLRIFQQEANVKAQTLFKKKRGEWSQIAKKEIGNIKVSKKTRSRNGNGHSYTIETTYIPLGIEGFHRQFGPCEAIAECTFFVFEDGTTKSFEEFGWKNKH